MLFLSKKKVPLKELIPKDFIDIHSHLLPGIDDGAKTVYESIILIEKFEEIGIKNVITTPHIMQDVWPNENETINNALESVKKLLKKVYIEDFNISVAAEYMLDDLFTIRFEKKELLTLPGNSVLVEMSTFNAPYNLFETLFEIKLEGYSPILAHPERYYFYHNDYKQYELLKEKECKFQINLLSLTGHYGKEIQEVGIKLLEANMIDYVGTDVHHINHIQKLKEGFSPKISKMIEPIMDNNKVFNQKAS